MISYILDPYLIINVRESSHSNIEIIYQIVSLGFKLLVRVESIVYLELQAGRQFCFDLPTSTEKNVFKGIVYSGFKLWFPLSLTLQSKDLSLSDISNTACVHGVCAAESMNSINFSLLFCKILDRNQPYQYMPEKEEKLSLSLQCLYRKC